MEGSGLNRSRRLTMPAPWTAGEEVTGRPPRHWKTPCPPRVFHIVHTAIIIMK